MVLLSSDRDYYSHVQAHIKIGLKQGREEANLKTAKNMLADGLPVSTIVRYTGLTEEQVKSLKD